MGLINKEYASYIIALRKKGYTFTEIGKAFGVTRQAIEALYSKYNKLITINNQELGMFCDSTTELINKLEAKELL